MPWGGISPPAGEFAFFHQGCCWFESSAHEDRNYCCVSGNERETRLLLNGLGVHTESVLSKARRTILPSILYPFITYAAASFATSLGRKWYTIAWPSGRYATVERLKENLCNESEE